MVDLRTLTIEQRQQICLEAERRARAGESPPEIRAALGVSKMSYSRWAKLFGFRQCDLHPGVAQACAPPQHPPGPGGYAYSGRRFRGLPPGLKDGRFVYGEDHPAWRGGAAAWRQRDLDKRTAKRRAAAEEVAALETPAALLKVVEAAQAEGDLARVDRLLTAWRVATRRDSALTALRQLAARDQDPYAGDDLTDEELLEEVKRLTGCDDWSLEP